MTRRLSRGSPAAVAKSAWLTPARVRAAAITRPLNWMLSLMQASPSDRTVSAHHAPHSSAGRLLGFRTFFVWSGLVAASTIALIHAGNANEALWSSGV